MLEDKIYLILEDIPNVYEGWYRKDLNETHTTFSIYNVTPTDFEDDDFTKELYLIQVDTWGTSKTEVDEQYRKVKRLLKNNEFIWKDSNRDFETETEIYHYADRFVIDLEVENED